MADLPYMLPLRRAQADRPDIAVPPERVEAALPPAGLITPLEIRFHKLQERVQGSQLCAQITSFVELQRKIVGRNVLTIVESARENLEQERKAGATLFSRNYPGNFFQEPPKIERLEQ